MREAWILAGILDGNVGYPRLCDDVCGIPHGLRVACDLALAGAKRIFLVWTADGPPPDVSIIANDRRLAQRATFEVVTQPPPGDDSDEVLVARADRLFHRDIPKLVLAVRHAAQAEGACIGKIRGAEHDAVFAMDRATARRFAERASYPAGIARELAQARPIEHARPLERAREVDAAPAIAREPAYACPAAHAPVDGVTRKLKTAASCDADRSPLDVPALSPAARSPLDVPALSPAAGSLAASPSLYIVEADVPYAGFTARASGPRSLRRAERQLVWSLRKAADGIAAKALNRHLSLPISWSLSRTSIHPNHITIAALFLALAGAGVIATGGYLAGIAGMLLVEFGSIIDGVDGELARLRFQFSRTGQWLDTTVDDLANVAYVTGIVANLSQAGLAWALPLGAAAICAFALTQAAQYLLIKYVYKSGDLAAIPWAFQSADFLAQKPTLRSTIPKMLKRDFVVSMFVVFAIAGRLDWILLVFAAGAFSFFAVFFVQLFRHRKEIQNS